MTLEALQAYLLARSAPATYAQVQRDLGAERLNDVTQALEMLMEQDAAAGRPFLAAMVISRTQPLPARGFYDMARALGREVVDETAFHAAELAALGKPLAKP